MTTAAWLKRIVLRRVPAVSAVEIRPTKPFCVDVLIEPAAGVGFEDAKKAVAAVLDDECTAGVRCDVRPFDQRGAPATGVPPAVQLASFAGDQSRDGLKRTLVKAVPSLGRATFEELRAPGVGVRIRVAAEDGSSSLALVERVRATVATIGYAGLPFAVDVLPADHYRNELANAGFHLPRRDADIVKLTEEDEETYALRIRRLVGGERDVVPLVDDCVGARVLATPILKPPLPLGCLLPFYDRIFLEMSTFGPTDTYFAYHFGTTQEDFLLYCERGRVVPIFKFNLGNYPRAVVQPWLDNLALPLVTPRAYDYVAMRHLWETSPYLRALREDRDLARQVAALARAALHSMPRDNKLRATYELLTWALQGAESFEGVAWHRGAMALGNLGAGGAISHVLAASPELFANKAIADTVTIESFAISTALSVAQAFDASLTEGVLLNPMVLQVVLPFFKDATQVQSAGETGQLASLIQALDLNYSGRIPAAEFLEVLDLAETRRIREITRSLLGEGADKATSLELRDRVQSLNQEVRKIERAALETAEVDVVGDLAKAGSTVAGAATGGATLGFKLVADLLQVPLLKKLGAAAFEKIIDDTRAGDALDTLRGAINGVSPEAIRIYRLRKKLSG